MNNVIQLISIIGLTLGAGFIIGHFHSSKKNNNIEKLFNTSDKIIDGADSIIKIVDTIIPNNPVLNVIKVIEKYAKVGVHEAEQLYINSKLESNERKNKAKETVYSILKELKINVTPNISKIIDGAIEAEVLALGHAPIDIKNLTEENEKLKKENNDLKEKVTTIHAVMTTD